MCTIARFVSIGLLTVAVALGCDDDPEPDEPEQPGHSHSHSGGHSHGHGGGDINPGHDPPRPDAAPATLVRFTGEVTLANAAASAAADIEAGQAIVVPEGGTAVIQLRDGGRVEAYGDTRLEVLTDGTAQIVLVRGAMWAVQPPQGNAPRPPLRATSSSATVEIGQSGELYMLQFDSGASWVAALAGAVAVSNGESDNRRQLREVDIMAGQAIAITARIAEPTEGPRSLAIARQTGAALRAQDGDANTAEQLEAELTTEAERLDGALRWLETETRRGRELTTQHRAAVREQNPDESQRLQNELVRHSQTLYRLRRLATARWERLVAKHRRLALLNVAQGLDPVASRRDRVAGLLGFQ